MHPSPRCGAPWRAAHNGKSIETGRGKTSQFALRTPEERTNPAILNGSRRQRIAKGSGTTIQEVNKLIKQFDETRKMMRMLTAAKPGSKKFPSFRR